MRVADASDYIMKQSLARLAPALERELNEAQVRAAHSRNVAERERAEQALLESRQRLEGIVTTAMDAIVTVDEDMRIVLSNPAAVRMFGYQAAELEGQPLDLLLTERFRVEHLAHIAAFGKSGITACRMGALRPLSGLRKGGEEFPIEARSPATNRPDGGSTPPSCATSPSGCEARCRSAASTASTPC